MKSNEQAVITSLKKQLAAERERSRRLEAILLCRNRSVAMLIGIQSEVSHATAELLIHKSISRNLKNTSDKLISLHEQLHKNINAFFDFNKACESNFEYGEMTISLDEIKFKIEDIKKLAALNLNFSESYSYVSILNTAKIDHAVWKASLYDMLANENFDKDLEKSTECRLGIWYGKMKENIMLSKTEEFVAIERPHNLMHKSGDRVIKSFKENDFNSMINHLNEMEDHSVDIINCIDRLINKIKTHE